MPDEKRKTTSMRLPESKVRIFNSIIAFKGEQFSAVIEGLIDRYIAENKKEYLESMTNMTEMFPDPDEGKDVEGGE